MSVVPMTRDQELAEALEAIARLWVKLDGAKNPKSPSMYIHAAQRHLLNAKKYLLLELKVSK